MASVLKMADFRGPASESQRVKQLQKRRERAQEEIEFKRKKLTDELKLDKMEAKFSAHYDAVETNLKSATVGLVTNEEMKKMKEEAVMAHEMALARKSKDELRDIRDGVPAVDRICITYCIPPLTIITIVSQIASHKFV